MRPNLIVDRTINPHSQCIGLTKAPQRGVQLVAERRLSRTSRAARLFHHLGDYCGCAALKRIRGPVYRFDMVASRAQCRCAERRGARDVESAGPQRCAAHLETNSSGWSPSVRRGHSYHRCERHQLADARCGSRPRHLVRWQRCRTSLSTRRPGVLFA